MCGINGILSKDIILKKRILGMNEFLKHRGPDDEGYVCINTHNQDVQSYSSSNSIEAIKKMYPDISMADLNKFDLIFGHRRLAIIDLSERGHQPMSAINEKIWITYNGEIYNYIELKEELRKYGYRFCTQTDTEVIIYSYLHWGEECFSHFNGMWAFALWDSRTNKLILARDRFGVKPLYYVSTNSYFAFSSELKPLISLNPRSFEINDIRIPYFVIYGNRLNNEDTYIKNIFRVRASHYLVYKDSSISIKRYYDIKVRQQVSKTELILKNEIIELLTDSVKLRFRSDVPVGTCLSGGLDSSGIVSLSTKLNVKGLNTFSAVWQDKECDESTFIDTVNNEFKCIGNKIEPSVNEFESVFNDLCYYQELPTEGPGLYPQWYVMKKAKGIVKVLLDGQGGDEVFGGYYNTTTYLLSLIKDKFLGRFLSDLYLIQPYLNKNGIHMFLSLIFPISYSKYIRGLISQKYKILNKDTLNKIKKADLNYDIEPTKKFKNYLNNLSYHYIFNITMPNLLHYEDRSSMAHSIESRVPFLDYRLVELGLNLPAQHILNKDVSRPLYRKALENYLPSKILNRKDKLGFPTPFAKWSRKALKPYIHDTLLSNNSKLYSFLNKERVIQNLKLHNEGKLDYSWEIWRLLSLNAFLNLDKYLLHL